MAWIYLKNRSTGKNARVSVNSYRYWKQHRKDEFQVLSGGPEESAKRDISNRVSKSSKAKIFMKVNREAVPDNTREPDEPIDVNLTRSEPIPEPVQEKKKEIVGIVKRGRPRKIK